ncbi:MAG: hypothetical protein ACH350_05410 [Parachlamydiaceae bacterium]
MIGRWISWLSCAFLVLALAFGFAGLAYWFNHPHEIVCADSLFKKCGLPKGAFELSEEAYEKTGESVLSLEQSPPAIQLPDLRAQLIYYGKNGRPDAPSDHIPLYFSFNGNNKNIASILPGEKLYLIYDKKNTPPKYSFSPNNEKTSLWIEASPINNEAQIGVKMEKDNGELVKEPQLFSQFRLPEKDFLRYGGIVWELSTFRVDGTLLSRQKAKWYGMDRFLEHHGGDDFKNIEGKQRVDFGDNDDLYSVFVKVGDALIWDGARWKMVTIGKESTNHPLLVVKKIDDRLIAFELWDAEGRGKIALNLLKSAEAWTVQNAQTLQNMFNFLGAKTRTQCVFEINRERVILKPADWLLLTPTGWKKLATAEEIDHYVKRKLSGTLFVFEGLKRKGEKQVMTGTLYSPTRHDCQPIELPLQVKKSKGSKDGKDLKERLKEAQEKAMAGAKTATLNRANETAPHLPQSNQTSATNK